MRVSKPKNCRESGVRQLAFEVDVEERLVYAGITCEAVLGKGSADITPDDVKTAIKMVEMDSHGDIAHKVAERARADQPGDVGLPIFLSTLDFP